MLVRRPMTALFTACGLCALLPSCASTIRDGAAASSERDAGSVDASTDSDAEAESRVDVAEESGTPPESALPYADSPITAFATVMTEVGLAAIQGRPLPTIPVATRAQVDPQNPRIEYGRSGESLHIQGEPRVVGFFFEVTFVLKVGQPDPNAELGTQDGQLRTLLYLSRYGLHVLGVESSAMSPTPGSPAPPSLSGLADVGRDILRHLAEGRIEEILVGEAESRLVNDEHLWSEVTRNAPRGRSLERTTRFATTIGQPQMTYRLDDFGIALRDEVGTLFGLELDFDELNGRIVLDTSPLIRVELIEPQ
jgi:hypothetical protein